MSTGPLPVCHGYIRDLATTTRGWAARQPVAAPILGLGGGISRLVRRTGGGARGLAGSGGELTWLAGAGEHRYGAAGS
jgi:hypothetical protein